MLARPELVFLCRLTPVFCLIPFHLQLALCTSCHLLLRVTRLFTKVFKDIARQCRLKMPPRTSLLASAFSTTSRSSTSDRVRAAAVRQSRQASSLQTNKYTLYPTERLSKDGPLLSRVSGPIDKPLSELSLGQFWEETVAKYADRPALISKHEPASQHGRAGPNSNDCIRWSYGAMNEHIQSLVTGLHQLGVRKGDRVAVLMM